MAYLDNSTILHAATDSAISATSYSANWIDLNITNGQGVTAYRDLARGGDLYALITIATAAADTAGNLEFQIVNTPKTSEAGMSTTGATLTIASDLVSWTAHGLPIGTPVRFSSISTTTGISANQIYYVAANSYGTDSFCVSSTLAEALKPSGGAVVNLATGNGTADVTALPTILGTTGPVGATLLTLGTQLRIRLNPSALHALVGTATNGQGSFLQFPQYRYLFARFVETGTITTVVPKVELMLTPQDGQKYYPTGFSIT